MHTLWIPALGLTYFVHDNRPVTGCKDICLKYKYNGKHAEHRRYYELGVKYCRRCEIPLSYSGLMCPCCGRKLRTHPRN